MSKGMSGAEHKKLRLLRDRAAKRQDKRCYWCSVEMVRSRSSNNGRLEPTNMTGDHIVPRALGGRTIESNIVAACYRCNQERGARPWRALGHDLAESEPAQMWR